MQRFHVADLNTLSTLAARGHLDESNVNVDLRADGLAQPWTLGQADYLISHTWYAMRSVGAYIARIQ